jgi:hypothetical protein
MAAEVKEFQGIDWHRTFAFLEIVRSFRMAIHPASLLLCFAGLAATFGIGVLVDQIPGIGGVRVYEKSFCENVYDIATIKLWGAWAIPYVHGKSWDDFLVCVMAPLSAGMDLLSLAWAYWIKAPWFALVNTVLDLGLWALIGGAVTRMAAVRVAREESLPLKKAVCFSAGKWVSNATCGLIPFGVLVLLMVLVGLPTGLFLMIPYVGEWVVGVFLFLPLLAGLVLALIFIGGTFSLGLQWPTVAAEGSDSFDAISRSVSYVSSRPWKYLFYTAFSAVYGCLTFVFVKFLTFTTLLITHESISTFCFKGAGMIDNKITRLWDLPVRLDRMWPQAGIESLPSEAQASYLFVFWVWVVLGLAMAFLISFFFASQTVIYFLLRKAVDATDIEEVYLEESEEDELPLEHKVEGHEAAPGAETPAAKSGESPPAPPPQAGPA